MKLLGLTNFNSASKINHALQCGINRNQQQLNIPVCIVELNSTRIFAHFFSEAVQQFTRLLRNTSKSLYFLKLKFGS